MHEILQNAQSIQDSSSSQSRKQASQIKISKRHSTNEETDKLAHEFVQRLTLALNDWLELKDMNEMDQKIQEFASKIAQGWFKLWKFKVQ